MNYKTLHEMSIINITEINTDNLVNADAITFPSKLTHEKKVLSAIEQLGNPYCFMSGDIPVRLRFINQEKSLSNSLVSYFSKLK